MTLEAHPPYECEYCGQLRAYWAHDCPDPAYTPPPVWPRGVVQRLRRWFDV